MQRIDLNAGRRKCFESCLSVYSESLPGPPPRLFKLIHYVAHKSIGKWMVGLPLKSLLVLETALVFISCKTKLSEFRTCLKLVEKRLHVQAL